MSESSKRLVGVKRLSLAGLADEWDEECYALYIPASYEQMIEIDEIDASTLTKREQVKVQLDLVKAQFVAGKLKAFNPTTESYELSSMTVEDAVSSIPVADALYAAIVGFDMDPKAIRREVIKSALQTSGAKSTETTLSETSPTGSTGEPTEK